MKKYSTFLLILIFSYCSTSPETKEKAENENKTGIYIIATHSARVEDLPVAFAFIQMPRLLSNGVILNLNHDAPIVLPYGKPKFFELKEGIIDYHIEMTLRNGGKVAGCLKLKPGQQIYLKYSTPGLITSPGILDISDAKTQEMILATQVCK